MDATEMIIHILASPAARKAAGVVKASGQISALHTA